MGKQKYLQKVMSFFKKSALVDFGSIERIVKNKKNVKQYTKQLIRNLEKQKKINKITKGFYSIHEDPSLIVFCFKPSYLGLQNALSFHNLWEQETVPVVVTARKIRQGIRKVLGLNVLVRRINKKYLFGFDYYEDGDFYFPYSDIEKTLIDLIYFRQPLDKEVIDEIKRRMDKKKLKNYLKKYPKKFRDKVLSKIN